MQYYKITTHRAVFYVRASSDDDIPERLQDDGSWKQCNQVVSLGYWRALSFKVETIAEADLPQVATV